MLNYYITATVIGNTGLGTLRMMDSAIKMNDFINALQDPCGHAGYEQSQFDLLLYDDKRSNACQHHIYNSLHVYHCMRALYPVYRQDREGCIELTQVAPLLCLSPLRPGITAYREHIGSCFLGEGE